MSADSGQSADVASVRINLSGPEWLHTNLSERSEASLLLLFGSLAGISFLVTCFYSFVVPQTPGRLSRESVDLVPQLPFWSWLTSLPVPIPDTGLEVAVSLLVFGAVAFAAYGSALYLSWKCEVSKRLLLAVVGMGLLFSFTNVWSLPNLNTDVFNYMARGRVAAVYGENPYGVAVDEFPDDPIYPYASQRFTGGPGGKLPAWMAINIFLARIAGDNPVTNVLTYRLALFLFNAASLALIVLIVRYLNPTYALAGAVLYSWNPIVILFAQSKTDTVMVFYLLMAVWLMVKGRRWVSIIFLVLSALVKLITVPLIAVYMLRNLRLKKWRQIAGDTLIGMLMAGSTFLFLYFSDEGARQVLKYVGLVQSGGPSEFNVLETLLQLLFVLVIIAAGLVQDGTYRRLLAGWAVVMLFFALFITRFSLSWYLLTPIAIVALVTDWRMAFLTLAVTFSSHLIATWNNAFTAEFPPPDAVALPRFLLYLSVPAVVAAFIAARLAWRRLRA